MFELFKLFGRLFVDNSGANQALDETGKKAEHTTSEMGQYAEKLKKWAAGLLTVSSAVSGLKKVWEISSQVADLGDSIDKSSQKFLLSREAYQEWAFVAEHSGFSIEQLGNAVVDLSKKVGQGSDDVLAALEEIGISAADAMTATPEELFDMVIAGLQGMENSTRKAYVADKLLGGAAKDLGPLLNANAEDTAALRDRFGELGGKMSDTLIDSSAAYGDALTDLSTAWQGVKNSLAEDTVPAMTDMVNGLTEMLTGDFAEGLKTAADGVEEYLSAIAASAADWAKKIRDSIESAWRVDLTPILDNPRYNPFWGTASYQNERRERIDQQQTFDEAMRYGEYGRVGNVADFFSSLWEGIRTGEGWNALKGKAATPSMDTLQRGYGYFVQQGGTQEDFLAQLNKHYGDDVRSQFEQLLQGQGSAIDTATEEYTDAIGGAADTWNQSAADVSAASSRAVAAMDAAADKLYDGGSVYGSATRDLYGGFSHANGLEFVPRDDYPARLHYGERVLTRQENAAYSAGQAGGSITINIQTTAQSPAQTAAAIQAALARARWAM